MTDDAENTQRPTPDQIRTKLAERGYNQTTFARAIRVNPRTVRRWCEDASSGMPWSAWLVLCMTEG